MADLIQRPCLNDFPLECCLVLLQAGGHLIKGGCQATDFILGVDLNLDGTLAVGDDVGCVGEAADWIGQPPYPVDGQEERDPQAENRNDQEGPCDHYLCVLEVLDRIDKVQHHGPLKGRCLVIIVLLIHRRHGINHLGSDR